MIIGVGCGGSGRWGGAGASRSAWLAAVMPLLVAGAGVLLLGQLAREEVDPLEASMQVTYLTVLMMTVMVVAGGLLLWVLDRRRRGGQPPLPYRGAATRRAVQAEM